MARTGRQADTQRLISVTAESDAAVIVVLVLVAMMMM